MARELLLTTKKGNKLLSEAESSLEAQLLGITIARMAVLSQGLEKSSVDIVENIKSVFASCKCPNKKELLFTLRRICERRSVPGNLKRDIGPESFLRVPSRPSFEYYAA